MREKRLSDELAEGVLQNRCIPNNRAKVMKVPTQKYTLSA